MPRSRIGDGDFCQRFIEGVLSKARETEWGREKAESGCGLRKSLASADPRRERLTMTHTTELVDLESSGMGCYIPLHQPARGVGHVLVFYATSKFANLAA